MDKRVMQELWDAYQKKKQIKVIIQFGTLQGQFVVEDISRTTAEEDWLFAGGGFSLRTGRYVFYEQIDTKTHVQYVFVSKLAIHPNKTIVFEVQL